MNSATHNPTAEIIAIGTEILLGEITDTNSVYIARTLRDIGVNLYYMVSVGDNETRIAKAIEQALERADIVITSGGLGPTIDDMTRQGVAKATGRELIFHQSLLDQIAARFASFRVKMTDNNRRQAYLPQGALLIENPVGTAPSFIVEQGDKCVISLPGVPRELKFLMMQSIIPYLQRRYQLGVIKSRVLHTAGIGESMLDDLIGAELLSGANPTVGLAAHQGCVDVRITAKSDTFDNAETMLNEVEARLRERIGKYIFGVDGEKLEEVLVRLLNQHQATIAIVEAGIERPVTSKLRRIADGSHIIYERHLDHPQNIYEQFAMTKTLPLRDLAHETARLLYESTGGSIGVAILSLPEVAENGDVQPSTAVAVYAGDTERVRTYGFGAQSDFAQSWVSMWAMAVLWQLLKEKFDGR